MSDALSTTIFFHSTSASAAPSGALSPSRVMAISTLPPLIRVARTCPVSPGEAAHGGGGGESGALPPPS